MNIGNMLKDVRKVANLKLTTSTPEIYLGVGLALFGIGVVEACKATIKAEDIIEPAIADVDDIKEDIEAKVMTKEEGGRELTKVYLSTTWKMILNYRRALICITLGGLAICKSHGLLREETFRLMAAWNVLNDGFGEYRKNVRNELGDEADQRFLYGLKKEKQIEEAYLDEDGNEKTKKVKNALVANPYEQHSPYSRFFDETSDAWSPSAEYNKTFILGQEASANDILRRRGWITLAEVYEMLGFDASEASLAVGWVIGNGEDKVKFDIFNVHNEASRRFVNGYEPSILLDFNVDGVILDKLRTIGLSQI